MTDATVMGRLDRLERANRRLRRAGVGLIVGVAAIALLGQAPGPQTAQPMETKHLILRDNNGKRRAELTTVDVEDGAPYLVLRDKEERVRLAVRLGRDGFPQISLRDKNGEGRMSVALNSNGAPGLDFWSTAGTRRASLYDHPKLGTTLAFYHDEDDTTRVFLSLASDGSTRLMLTEPYVALSDKGGKTLWKAP